MHNKNKKSFNCNCDSYVSIWWVIFVISASRYICEYEREDESDEEEWVDENEADPSRNIFDVFDDEEDL